MASNSYAAPFNSSNSWSNWSGGGNGWRSNRPNNSMWSNVWDSASDMERDAYNADSEAGYGLYAQYGGIGQSGAYQNYLNNNKNRYYNQYLAARIGSPMQFTDFLKTINPMSDFARQEPGQRGERGFAYAPTMRRVGR